MDKKFLKRHKLVFPHLTEDWWAVIVGLLLVALVLLGILGPIPW